MHPRAEFSAGRRDRALTSMLGDTGGGFDMAYESKPEGATFYFTRPPGSDFRDE